MQEGAGRLVVHDLERGTVRKTFGRGPDAQALAEEEFIRLERFRAALDHLPNVASPRPIELAPGASPSLEMAFLPGKPLCELLSGAELDQDLRIELLGAMKAAIAAHVELLGEPYHDFNFSNVLYDSETGTVGFVDLGRPQYAPPHEPEASDYEVTLGRLLASVVFESARPQRLRRRRLHRQAAGLAVDLVGLVQANGHTVRTASLLRVARDTYARNTFGRRSLTRSVWYATIGWALGQRVAVGGQTFVPPSLISTRRASSSAV